MSAIVAVYRFDGRDADPALLVRMSDAMAHRGTDGGAWCAGSIGLAHRQWAFGGECASERQPLCDSSGVRRLVFDGRIDNAAEVNLALASAGIRLRDGTDAELILAAYRAWGREFVRRIVGEFAFALWDGRRRELVCGRDALGERPLYYAYDGRSFVCASEIQPLFAGSSVAIEPNPTAFATCLSEYCSYQAATFYKRVFRLLPGHLLFANADGVRTCRYWDLDPAREIRYRNDSEYSEHFVALFQQSVACRLRSDARIGATLSGGLDSSAIVSTARVLCGASPNSFETFSILLPDQTEEHTRIRSLVNTLGLESTLILHQPTKCYEDPLRYQLYPDSIYAPAAMMFEPLYRAMKERGIKVALDGTGGDELLVTGLSHLTDLLRARRFPELAMQLLHAARYMSVPASRLFVDFCVRPLVAGRLPPFLRRITARLGAGPMKPLVCEPLRDLVRGADSDHHGQFRSCASQALYEEISSGWNLTVLREMMGLFSARLGIEIRRPFLDRRLVEFIFAIPDDQRWHGDQTRYVLRNAMKGVVPEAVRLQRRKVLFDSVVERELNTPAVRTLLEHSALVEIGVVDPEGLHQRVERFFGTGRGAAVFGLLIALELYCRQILNLSSQRRSAPSLCSSSRSQLQSQ